MTRTPDSIAANSGSIHHVWNVAPGRRVVLATDYVPAANRHLRSTTVDLYVLVDGHYGAEECYTVRGWNNDGPVPSAAIRISEAYALLPTLPEPAAALVAAIQ